MPAAAKSSDVLTAENKSHRTKAELGMRAEAEKALSTGVALRERSDVKKIPIAHKEFQRLNKLLVKIKKNDAIHESVINRYCLMMAECADLEKKKEKIFNAASKLEEKFDALGDDATFQELREVTSGIARIYGMMIECDKQIQAKRKMLLDIEKENCLTMASALRSIPKKEEPASRQLFDALHGSGSG